MKVEKGNVRIKPAQPTVQTEPRKISNGFSFTIGLKILRAPIEKGQNGNTRKFQTKILKENCFGSIAISKGIVRKQNEIYIYNNIK